MATGKKSFVLYSDQKEIFEHLTDEQSGKLIKHIFRYVNDENPTCKDSIVNLAFITIKASLKRDLDKWEKQLKQRSAAGKASAKSRQRNSTSVNERQRNSTDSVNVSVNDSVSDNEKKETPLTPKGESFDFDVYLEQLNKLFDRQFKVVNSDVKRKMKATLKTYTKQNVWIAMQNCKNDPHHIESNYRYCTAEFFARQSTLERHGDKLRENKTTTYQLID